MAIKIKIYNQQAEPAGEMELDSRIFGKKVNSALVHQAVVAQMANQRQVLAHTKTKGEVRGGGKKPWRQKGTGRARVGSNRSPLWRSGGITFGPRADRNFSLKINQKMKQNALFMALSDKVASSRAFLLDKVDLSEYKTKNANQIIKNIEAKLLPAEKKPKSKETRSILFVDCEKKDEKKYSFRNLSGVKLSHLDGINLVEILKYRYLIFTTEAIKKLEERYKK